MNLPSKLYELQKVADKLYGAQKRVYEIDQHLSNDEKITKANAEFEQAQALLHSAEHAVKEKEALEKELQNKVEFSNSTLYGGMVKNPKELQDLQKESESLKKRIKGLEDEHLSAISAMEDAQSKVESAKANLDKIKEEFEVRSAALLEEKEGISKQIKVFNQEYMVTVNNLPADMRQAFETLFKTKKGKAVAFIEDGSCSVCGITVRESLIQQIKASNQIIYCPSCGRMLFTE